MPASRAAIFLVCSVRPGPSWMTSTPGRRALELSSTTYWPTMRTPSARYSMSWVRILSLHPSLVADPNRGRLSRQRLAATSRPAWLFAKRHGGTFILRLDDTDRQRSKPEYEAAIECDLSWLGLDWASKERQVDRLAHYDAARDRLIAAGRLSVAPRAHRARDRAGDGQASA